MPTKIVTTTTTVIEDDGKVTADTETVTTKIVDRGIPTLYTYWRSSCSWRVRLALNWKGIKFDSVPVHLVKDGGEQLKPSYTRVNPMMQVPTLAIDDLVLSESIAIIEYLDEAKGGRAILPADPVSRAKVREIVNIIASGIQPVQNLRVLRKHGIDKKVEWGQWAINHGFVALEEKLTTTAGKYCLGDEVTLADMCLVPQVYNAKRFKVDMSKYPTIARINEALATLPEFEKAHPSAQPDAQPA
mmetsp:Transcript_37445/g.98205  ORF Transcript_37445/g.98205 Transcript_37445/m.98205 type:complete len:244 (+) Transcript_37445:129-860(+)|eukprot:CAMPEP_0182926844 /NCGR_PEP_ID=MMETSP0105_2-20130417/12387_1 /TAXON_ID=81532 ORGANISM="Acanthoeca-like sp., Strain 10tr" /NCGR_SAMPLE_ID=MMETSP0105_2 /ASSEMBLY_ACC=CAM_ASM_000205 /LENGTH=243 /DNA_ID=CAMNT_0025064755 /DNA_START=107 /DNA_END=838 /DNA_ORIENTATION=+